MWFFTEALLVLSVLETAIATTSRTGTATSSPSTCPSRTVNYITHSLPQQCLTSSRKVNITSTTTEGVGSSTVELTSAIQTTVDISNDSSTPSSSGIESTCLEADASVSDQPSNTSEHTLTTPSPEGSAIPQPTDEDSPLEDGKFLSFEDWKKENLKKAGQSEHLGRPHGSEPRDIKKQPSIVQDTLDALGDDAEIDLDFSGFVSDNIGPPSHAQPRASQDIRGGPVEPGRAPRGARSRDAGTTCKERFNYASYDCAATILKTNPEAKSANAVLGKNKDSYMLNECSAQNKYIIMELCDDISIDTIVLANFEFFSSTFRTFRVSVSDKYPVKVDKWKTLGTFEARNTRDVQAFLVENPVIWARYLRIEFLSQYGSEYYCPVSLVRVHGTTMLDEYKHDLEFLHADEDDIEERDDGEVGEVDALVPEAVAEPLLTKSDNLESEASPIVGEIPEEPISNPSQITNGPINGAHPVSVQETASVISTSPANFSAMFIEPGLPNALLEVCDSTEYPTKEEAGNGQVQSTTQASNREQTVSTSRSSTSSATSTIRPSISGPPLKQPSDTPTMPDSSAAKSAASSNSTIATTPSTSTVVNGTRMSASSTQAPAAAPTMQESFFKSVQKRLQMLESNSSLSLQYIEEQSRALRDAFQKVEQRQLAKTTSFLEYLNMTVLNELRDFRQQYDQLWQSTVIELEMQRERYQQENMAINARLGVLADEVIFQKRMSILQMLLILICLGLVLFSRGSLNSYLELPLVQSVLARSPSSKWLSLSGLDSPSHSQPVTRANSTGTSPRRQGILKGHRHLPSEDTVDEALSPSDPYAPLTPVSIGSPSEGDDYQDGSILGDPQFDPSLIERPSTSPPVLPGTETPSSSADVADIADGSMESKLMGSPTDRLEKQPPLLVIADATPPSKQLKWNLPNS
ncbi:hypothetical protein LTR47_009175 [Exophiala xenobiotica]|nr:hypothetical protein LTR41_009866 [Exophiala xenobiotica]KAK5226285.1 hypothetical protein LTR47_009175 [Exophiala xenobiotica]KAK5351366.1 hypothetical protein LTR61_004715 [Exophiala xenobiotica]KAK5383702.1 hypothetical protein LTR11_002712 [Exophiala xenobiotica]KAK5384987.1 hypothetical protein LTS03_002952 [Exophiala xenobiotica]